MNQMNQTNQIDQINQTNQTNQINHMEDVMKLRKIINALIYPGEEGFVAECMEIAVVTQGKTIDETINNLKEAVALHLENEDLSQWGLADNPTLVVTFELETEYEQTKTAVR
jgi:predicted RNase H-like HicB family nuclease